MLRRTLPLLFLALLAGCMPVGQQSPEPENLADDLPFSASEEPDQKMLDKADALVRTAKLASGTVLPVSWGASGSIVIGNADAPVTLWKFLDLSCEYCKAFDVQDTEWLQAAYILPGKVKMEIAFLPLKPAGDLGARADICAMQQDKFLPMHRYLLGQENINQTAIVKELKNMGIDSKKFQQCLQHADTTLILNANKKLAADKGVERVPAFFLNNRSWLGMVDSRNIAMMIEEELRIEN